MFWVWIGNVDVRDTAYVMVLGFMGMRCYGKASVCPCDVPHTFSLQSYTHRNQTNCIDQKHIY